jgi:NADPH:quinone reductase-like Zn-dependent oxidoreductase
MKAMILSVSGDTNNFESAVLERPILQQEEVLIAVKAISINPVDVKTRLGKGLYGRIKEESPLILGWDISGIVEETNSDRFKVGDAVFGMVNFPGYGKGYAEYVAAPAAHVALKPTNISHEEAAAATLAALTAYQALVKHVNVQPGQNVLIHAAAGGVGHFAVQLAKHLGAVVVGTSSAKNKDFVMQLGADEHIDYHGYDWENQNPRFDFILDPIGGDYIDLSLFVAKPGSTLISIPSGLNEEVTAKAAAKGVNGYFFLVNSSAEDQQVIARHLEQGEVKAHVSARVPFEEMGKAHELVGSGRTVGKVVVVI